MKNPSDDNFERRVAERLSEWEPASTKTASQRRWKSLQGPLAQDRLQRLVRRQRWLAAAVLLLLWPAAWGIYHFISVDHAPNLVSRALRAMEPSQPEDVWLWAPDPVSTQNTQIAGLDGLPVHDLSEVEDRQTGESDKDAEKREVAALGDRPGNPQVPQYGLTLDAGETPEFSVVEVHNYQDTTGSDHFGLHHLERFGPKFGSFLLPSLAVFISSIGQTSEPSPPQQDTKPTGTRAAYATVMPLMNYQQVIPNPEDDWYVASLDQPGIVSPDRLGYRAAIGYEQQLFDSKIVAHIEAAYTFRRGQFAFRYHGTDPDTSVWKSGSDGTINYTPVYQIRQGAFSYTSHSMGLQLGVQYELTDWFGHHYLLGGYEAAWVIQEDQVTLQEASKQVRATPQHLFTFGYRFDRPLNDHWSFRLQPSIRYAIRRPDLPELPVSVQPFSYGLNLGIVYHWGRKK